MKGIIRSLLIVIKNTFIRSITVLYPYDRVIIPYNSRGSIRLVVDLDTKEIICDGCGECVNACPLKLISVEKVSYDKKIKNFYVDISRCLFCGLCEEACKKDALKMNFNYELAERDFSALRHDIDKLTEYAKPKVKEFWKS